MAVKKTSSKKTTTTVAKKPTAKVVKPVESSVKKDSIMHKATVETKRTDRCECDAKLTNNDSCSCCHSCGLVLKRIILILLILNIIISCFFLCKKSTYSLETLKIGWKENMENVVNNLYKNENYIKAQKEEINAYLEQLWVN